MKQLLKVLLVMGWSLNLFASEDVPAFLALATLNTASTKDLVTIIRNQRTSPETKVDFFSRVVNGLTLSDFQKGLIRDLLLPLILLETATGRRISFSVLCLAINEEIKSLGVTQRFLPETSLVGLSAGQIFATWAFIKLFVYRFFTSQSEIDTDARSYFEKINVENIVKAYAP